MTTEENDLERALRLAANEPASRPDFYRLLVDSEVVVIGNTQRESDGVHNLNAGESVAIQNWQRSDGKQVIPFFTSLDALQRAITEPANYLKMPARTLFEMTKGGTLVLNPTLAYGKEFFPSEIEALLSNAAPYVPESRVIQKQTQVLLGQPRERPSQMIDALTALFEKRSQVKAAFLLLMGDAPGSKPHLVVGIDADGDVERLLREAGGVAADTAPNREPVDVHRIQAGDNGLSDHFLKHVGPFYKRSFGAKLRDLIGSGRE